MSCRRPVAIVVDDDAANRLLLCDAALQAGCDVVEAADGSAALAAAFTHEFDIMLLDVEMPQLNGFEVCRQLRQRSHLQFKPIVMITGHDDSASIQQAYEAGATDFMSKPLNWPLVPHRLRYIIRNAANEQRVRRMAYFDSLTGLPNLQSFLEFTADSIATEHIPDAAIRVAVLKVSAAGVERIAQSLGREVADGALINFGQRMLAVCNKHAASGNFAQVARLEGARFAICLRENDARSDAQDLAAQIIADFNAPVIVGEHTFFLRPIIGISRFPEHGRTAPEIMMHAGAALQQSRRNVASMPVVYNADIGQALRQRLALDSELRRAVRDEMLTLHFQPKIRLSDYSIAGVEALLRWFHPELGPVSPAQFIPIAEESGLILEIGDWVIRAAFRQLMHWRHAGLDCSIAVNVAGAQFQYGDPAAVIIDAAKSCQIEPNRLSVEITESSLLGEAGSVRAGLASVRAAGCRLAIDDFGTGYSSFAYLQHLQVDELKVDREFVQTVDSNSTDAAIYAAILSLARQLRLTVTAEGVERTGQLEWLRQHGCTEAQGYLIGKPMPAHDILKLYGSRCDPAVSCA